MKNSVRKVMMAMMMLTFTTMMSAQRYESLYTVKGNKAMFDGKEIRHADVNSFQILGNGYAKDRYNVYLDGQVLRFVDPDGFRLYVNPNQNGHAFDGNNRPDGFAHPGGNGQIDGQVTGSRGHDHGNNAQYGQGQYGQGHQGQYGQGNGNRGYGNGGDNYNNRPNNAVYVVNNHDVLFQGRRVQGATASSFKDLGDGYGKDSFNVYYYGDKIQGASGSSFKVVGEGYSKDAFNVYYYGEKVKGVSASSFAILGEGYIKDAFNVYFNGEKVQGATPSSFKVDGRGYAHDTWNSYYNGKKVK